MVTLTEACSFAELGEDLRAGRQLTNVSFRSTSSLRRTGLPGFSDALEPETAKDRCIWGDRVFFMEDGAE